MLTDLTELRAWVEAGRGGPAFNRMDKINWFVRAHREELMAAGVLIPGVGSRPTLVTAAFDELVERILIREAQVQS
jgi:hypothetical protein